MPVDERLPDLIEARRPQASLPLLLQRFRSCQSAWLPVQDIQVVLEIQDLLLAPVTTLVVGHASPVMPQLHRAGIGFGLDLRAGGQWHRVAVRQDLHATQTVDRWKAR